MKNFLGFSLFFLMTQFFSCGTVSTQEERLAPRRTSGEIRLEYIREQITKNPAWAIDLIGAYRKAYQIDEDTDDEIAIINLQNDAIDQLKTLFDNAINNEQWDNAASYRRSLESLNIQCELSETDIIIAGAKKKLKDGNNIGAFLSAVQASEQQPLSFEDSMLFLERAVEVKQRRTAAFFVNAAELSGNSNQIPAVMREYAAGTDSPAEMIKGVATVLVDRGIKIERGRGYADKILGSAFFIDSTGLLITNYHVISSEVDPKYEGYSRMYIRLGDSTSPRYPARVIGWDKAMDLALIKTEYKSEFIFSVVDNIIPNVGDTIIAIGSPGGLEKTVTSGIVSALSRRFLQIGDVIQIDAAVNYGNSGGPVVDTAGRLVGIVFAGIPQYQGLNFAVPARRLAAALPAMIKGGKAERPWIGLTICETSSGAEIIYTAPNTPSARHQIPEGSLIKSINGRQIQADRSLLIPALQDALFQSPPGELLALETVDNNGNTLTHVVMTVLRPEMPLIDAARIDSRERIAAPLFGMILSPGHGKSWSSTYLVKKIVLGSMADEAGISENDPVIIRGFRILETEGYALMDLTIKKRSMGYLETTMQLPAYLDSPDTL
ncbi:MAG: S1C family serine protease [Treponema sp.]|nr:S1C family serine protease [Treponema sp.]